MDPLTNFLISLGVSVSSDVIINVTKSLFAKKPNATASDVKSEIRNIVGDVGVAEKIFNFLQNSNVFVIQGHYTVGNNNVVAGNLNITNGDGNVNFGSQNEINGHGNIAFGHGNKIG